MKKAILGLCLLLFAAAAPMATSSFSQSDDSFPSFWTEFKTAVIKRDRKAVARLSKFPITVARGTPKIQDSAELSRRFGDLFDRQTSAAECFATREPIPDTESPNLFTVVCPYKKDVYVAYEFQRTKLGWRFIHRQFPTNCGCR